MAYPSDPAEFERHKTRTMVALEQLKPELINPFNHTNAFLQGALEGREIPLTSLEKAQTYKTRRKALLYMYLLHYADSEKLEELEKLAIARTIDPLPPQDRAQELSTLEAKSQDRGTHIDWLIHRLTPIYRF